MTTIAQDLGGVVRLLEKATPGKWNHYESKYDGDVYMVQAAPPKMHVLCRYNGDGDGYTQQEVDNAAAIAAAVNFLRTHSAEIAGALRDAEGWQPIETAPRDGSRILAMIRWSWSDGTDGEAQDVIYWYAGGKFWVCGTPMNYVQGLDEGVEPTHWRPLPAPPTQDSAMQQGGGGE